MDDEVQRAKLTKTAAELAARAIEYDQGGQRNPAIQYYKDAIQMLMSIYDRRNCPESIAEKIKEYIERADSLTEELEETEKGAKIEKSQENDFRMAAFLLSQAIEQDEKGDIDGALTLYTEAAELCLLAKSITTDDTLKRKLFKVSSQAVERVEVLGEIKRKIDERNKPSAPPQEESSTSHIYPELPLPVQIKPPPVVTEGDKYSTWELSVLAKTSIINDKQYVPFLGVDAHEKFAMTWAFEDRDGLLDLSPSQRTHFKEWVRPSELVADPKLVDEIDPLCIKQTCITDCSFISSLTVCAFYEKKFNRRLVTDIIYPKNSRGEPVFNPCGKYTVKFHINGVPRKVTLDDRLPIGRHNNLLCSYSQNKNEFWVSLLEKAYMKVMGGYNFPGSNSGVDLHALTGWIPDREPIRPGEKDFNGDSLFSKVHDRYNKGDVLLTVSTGEMDKEKEDLTGLASLHAYAVLRIVDIDGRKLFLLKNPWSHMRWKGRYSDRDLSSWTEELKSKLKYDPKNAQQFDNGVFWIDYRSILAAFDVFNLSWRPSLFQFTSCTHDMWHGGVGPAKGKFMIGDNPQYHLSVSRPGAAVWVLLTRHITDIEDFANNKEYIALMVYEGGNKVYLPYDPPPIIDGDRVNSPHYLVKILLQPTSGTRYTLVVSQYNKSTTIYYTIRAYSTVPFTLSKIADPYRFTKEDKKGGWGPATAGGCPNHPLTYGKNPVYRFDIQSPHDRNQVLIVLKAPKEFSIGFEVVPFALDRVPTTSFARQFSGHYRTGCAVLEIFDVPAGKFNLIPSTFNPGQEGPFFVSVSSDHQLEFCRVQT